MAYYKRLLVELLCLYTFLCSQIRSPHSSQYYYLIQIMLFKLLWIKSYGVTIQMKLLLQQYFHVVLFI